MWDLLNLNESLRKIDANHSGLLGRGWHATREARRICGVGRPHELGVLCLELGNAPEMHRDRDHECLVATIQVASCEHMPEGVAGGSPSH